MNWFFWCGKVKFNGYLITWLRDRFLAYVLQRYIIWRQLIINGKNYIFRKISFRKRNNRFRHIFVRNNDPKNFPKIMFLYIFFRIVMKLFKSGHRDKVAISGDVLDKPVQLNMANDGRSISQNVAWLNIEANRQAKVYYKRKV